MGSDEPREALVWEVKPFAGQRLKGTSALAVVAATIYAAFTWGGLVMGFLAVLILVGGTGPFFVTTRYRLTPVEVAVDSPFKRLRRPWGDYRKAYAGDQGVFLSPFRGKHLLEPYRGVMLRYGDRKDEVLAWVRRYGPAVREDGGGGGGDAAGGDGSGRG
jgi:hypothetical protein